MKKLVLAGLLLSGVSLMGDYVAGVISCEHKSGEGHTFFIVRGVGNNLSSAESELAMADFLNAEYSGKTKRYCKHGEIYSTDGTVFSYRSKKKANQEFADLINEYKNESFVKKLIIIRRGYDESDWR